MLTIISTNTIKNRVEKQLVVTLKNNSWITPNSIPYKKNKIVSILQKNNIQNGNVIILVKYGNRNPADFPEIYFNNYLLSIVFYKNYLDILLWLNAINQFDKKKSQKALSLAMMKPFYLEWGNKIYNSLKKQRYNLVDVKKHFADSTTAKELSKILSTGSRLAIYVGHGRSRGWTGYRGFRWKHIELFKQKNPIGCFIALSCSSLFHDKKETIPLHMQLVMEGRNCTFLGTWDSVKIIPLRIIVKIILDIFSKKKQEPIGEVLKQVSLTILKLKNPLVEDSWKKFKLLGNPLQKI